MNATDEVSSNDVLHSEERLKKSRREEYYPVQHAFLKWTIENFSRFPKRKDKYCLSPTFELKGTSWNLALHPRAKICGVDKIALNLIRYVSDPGPEKVTASYRMGLENVDNKIWFTAEERRYFGKGDSYGFQTSILGHLEDFLSKGIKQNDDNLSVLCEIYVWDSLNIVDNFEWVDEIKHFTDLDFWRDTLSMFHVLQSKDVLIKCPKLHIRAHKCVLFARSKTISRFLEDDKSFVELNCTSSCLTTALLFMYSGNFSYLVKNCVFSIGLYELACELRLCKLKLLLIPQKIEKTSKIVQEDCKALGKMEKFLLSDILNNKKRKSITYFNKRMDIVAKISFQIASNSKNYVVCRVGLQGLSESLNFAFDLYLLNEYVSPKKILRTTLFNKLGFKNSIYNYIFTFSVDDVMSCVTENTLYVTFVCQKCSLKHSPETVLNTNKYEKIPCYDHIWLVDLSSDFENLYETGQFSDITLRIGNKMFRVHRSILMARSEYFRMAINFNDSKDKIKDILNINPDILNLMCTYIYCGVLRYPERLSIETMLQLYDAAESYRVRSLAEECEDFISAEIPPLDPEFVYDILSVAYTHKNESLMIKCIDYINSRGIDSPRESIESVEEIEEESENSSMDET